MRGYWNQQLARIAQVDVPDHTLADAYRSGFVYTMIARSGLHSDTGVNNYEAEFSHDVIGIRCVAHAEHEPQREDSQEICHCTNLDGRCHRNNCVRYRTFDPNYGMTG